MRPNWIDDMIMASEGPRNEAVMAVQFEGGFSPGELLATNVEDVSFDQHGVLLRVNGKTGPRTARLVTFVHYLRSTSTRTPAERNMATLCG